MKNRETLRALISANDKRKVRVLGHGLLQLGWTLHAYGNTKKHLEGKLVIEDAEPVPGLVDHEPLAVSGVGEFIGPYDENDRQNLSGRLADHLRLKDVELAEADLPGIDLLYMNPLVEHHDPGYVDLMNAAADAGKIVIARMADIAPTLEWLGLGRPSRHAVSIAVLQETARREIACYSGAV